MNAAHDPSCAGWVLAGGQSSRMGSPKALLQIAGLPLLSRAVSLLQSVCSPVTVVGSPESYSHLSLAAVPDELPQIGPLGGIFTALARSASDWNLVVACDLPYLTAEWLRYLVARASRSRARVVLPHSVSGAEPLCAVYHRDIAASLRAAIAQGRLKVTSALDGLPIDSVTPADILPFDPRGLLFQNLNTPEDFERARAGFESG
ncbi:MAG TPA: molybdenum cofactor guanylyltransferase [Candidatus Acidoferrales bacterium]|nr:molybdenum cofactor guanylyltransferase [Candidatus Acidoferrales bacterium]